MNANTETTTDDDIDRLWKLANQLSADAEELKERHDRQSWQHGQALGFEKASDKLADELRRLSDNDGEGDE